MPGFGESAYTRNFGTDRCSGRVCMSRRCFASSNTWYVLSPGARERGFRDADTHTEWMYRAKTNIGGPALGVCWLGGLCFNVFRG